MSEAKTPKGKDVDAGKPDEKAVRELAMKSHMERARGREIVVSKIQKDFGEGALTSMTNHALDVARVSTGVLTMDISTGGGMPQGRILEFYGPRQSGKTTRAAAVMAQAQRLCMNCYRRGKFEVMGQIDVKLPDGKVRRVDNHVLVGCPCGDPKQCEGSWFDAEGSFDPVWFDRQGIWPEHCFLSRPVSLEEALDVMYATFDSGQFDWTVFDSVAVLSPQEEMTKSALESIVGVAAQRWNRHFRKCLTAQSKAYRLVLDNKLLPARERAKAIRAIPSLLMINQIRYKVGVMFGNPETTPGGEGLPFAASMRIRFAGDKFVGESKEDDRLTAHKMRFKVDKSKVASAGSQGEYILMQGDTEHLKAGEIDQASDVVDYGLKSGVIEEEGKGYYRAAGVYERDAATNKPRVVEDEFVKRRFRGKGEMERYFLEHRDDMQHVYDEIVFRMTGTRY